jgi:hypothetical protein
MRFNHADNDIPPFFFSLTGGFQHGVCFSNTGAGAKKSFKRPRAEDFSSA